MSILRLLGPERAGGAYGSWFERSASAYCYWWGCIMAPMSILV
jgi:hypothetical protein